jgi:hypothetical protein
LDESGESGKGEDEESEVSVSDNGERYQPRQAGQTHHASESGRRLSRRKEVVRWLARLSTIALMLLTPYSILLPLHLRPPQNLDGIVICRTKTSRGAVFAFERWV